jgi:hypothetical protein
MRRHRPCTHTTDRLGDYTSCPNWPACVGPGTIVATDQSTLGQDLAALAGWAAGAVLLLIVAAILLPLFV